MDLVHGRYFVQASESQSDYLSDKQRQPGTTGNFGPSPQDMSQLSSNQHPLVLKVLPDQK